MASPTSSKVRSILVVTHHLSIDSYASLTNSLHADHEVDARLLVLSRQNAISAGQYLPAADRIECFEDFISSNSFKEWSADELLRRYGDVPWGAVIASERSFSDYCFLLGSTGFRPESMRYIVSLVARFVGFFDQIYDRFKPDGVVTAFGDNLFTFLAAIVAEEKNIALVIPQPSFLNEKGSMEGGYFGNTRYLESFSMVRKYMVLNQRPLTNLERMRAQNFAECIKQYDGKKTLKYIYGKEKFEKPLTPQLTRLFSYLREQSRMNPIVEFYKISVWRKVCANCVRFYRYFRTKNFLASQTQRLPDKSVFFAMHFQPEASTLVNGIWYSNQICVIETLSKALPPGYTLIVKEHPRGRGMRPLWQYRHIASLYNVCISDLPSKEIAKHCKMVVSVSGLIGLEALSLEKPVLMLGRTFHTFHDLYYRIDRIESLPKVFRRVLLDREFERRNNLQEDIYRVLLAYLEALYPKFPVGTNMRDFASEVVRELGEDTNRPREFLEHSLNPSAT